MIEIEHGGGAATRTNASELAVLDRDPDRDLGATLTELLITVMLLGLVVTSLVSAVIVLVRQTDNTEGRLNVARAETSVGLWMPADLASADSVEVDPSASPCGTTCPPNAVTGGVEPGDAQLDLARVGPERGDDRTDQRLVPLRPGG